MCVTSVTDALLHALHTPLRHGSHFISHHVIVSFDFIIEYINSLGGVDLPFEHYVFTGQTLVDCYLLVPKMFLKFD